MLTFSLANNIQISALLLILNISTGFSQFLSNTQVLTIADDVRNLRFDSAQEQVLKLNNRQSDDVVAAVVHQVYSNSENNSEIILDFADDVFPVNLSFQILRALKNEMAANNHSDPTQLIKLYRAFEYELIYKRNETITPSHRLEIILEEIKASVKGSSKQILKAAMFSNNFEHSDFVKNVTSRLFNFNYTISDTVMEELAKETYPAVPAAQLADNLMYGSVYIPQKITFFLALYKQLEINNDLNNEAVVKLAYFFKVLKRSQSNYRNLFSPKKHEVNDVIKRMPICARNLYFAEYLCIWNRGRSEYLYAARSQHNLSRRGIFTYDSEDLDDLGIWSAVFYENVYFESLFYKKEFLYASSSDKYNPATRHVLTWVDDGFVGDTCAWNIELNGDYCFIKNVNFNEYLYTSDKIHAEGKRYVFTGMSGSGTMFNQPDFQWQIRNCGYSF